MNILKIDEDTGCGCVLIAIAIFIVLFGLALFIENLQLVI